MTAAPSNLGLFYGLVYAPDGTKLHLSDDAWKENQYWNDACWNRCVPQDCASLSYLDVGCAEGNYALRFEQRGGEAKGLDFYESGRIVRSGNPAPSNAGAESTNPRYQHLKEIWNAKFQMFVGGFSEHGSIVPTMDKVSIASSINVLEYIDDHRRAVESLFSIATDRVLIATDVTGEGDSGPCKIPNVRIQVFRLGELVSWCPWPCVFWQHEVLCDGRMNPQAFICATNPNSKLPPVDSREITYDRTMGITETQRFWEEKHK